MLLLTKKLCYWVWTELSTLAGLTEFTHPYFIKLVHGMFHDFRVICQDAGLEVPLVIRLHANARAS